MFIIQNNPQSKEVYLDSDKRPASEPHQKRERWIDQSSNQIEDFLESVEDRLMCNQQILEYLFDLKWAR